MYYYKMRLLVFSALIVSLFLFATCAQQAQTSGQTPTISNVGKDYQPAPEPETQPAKNTVEITSSGYSPPALTIKAGETVTWVNNDASAHWIASAQHPTHRVYSGSDIAKCGTPEEKNIFDACSGIKPGDSWSFTFNEKGSWNYHDHLNVKAPFFGKIIVE